jgi:hypothetical protein
VIISENTRESYDHFDGIKNIESIPTSVSKAIIVVTILA